jgi:hypothetical protein
MRYLAWDLDISSAPGTTPSLHRFTVFGDFKAAVKVTG